MMSKNTLPYFDASGNIWDTAIDGQPGSRLVVQDDSNVVIYRPDGAPI